VATCNSFCAQDGCLGATLNARPACESIEKQITSDQWRMSLRQLPPSIQVQKQDRNSNMLVIAVSELELQQQSDGATKQLKLAPGGLVWLPAGDTQILKNNTADAARYVTLEFPPEKQ
jgi:glyoxylate utilization-related uncharacterized protein